MIRKRYVAVGILSPLLIAAVIVSYRSLRSGAADHGSAERRDGSIVQPYGLGPSTMSAAEFHTTIENAISHSTPFAPTHPDQFCSAASELMNMAVASSSSTAGEWLSWFHKRDMILDRKLVVAVFNEYHRWAMTPKEIIETTSEEDIARVLWESTRARKMLFTELDPSSIEVGSRLDAVLDSQTWPYTWIHSQSCFFVTRNGGLKADDRRTLVESNRTGFVQQRVRFIDGRWGHVRISMYYAGDKEGWIPASISIATEQGDPSQEGTLPQPAI